MQPHFIGSFFREAFTLLGGRIAEREKGRFEITRVPSVLKERDRLIGRGDPVLDRYARVTFEKTLIVGQPQAELLAPGHPLLDAAVDVVLERFGPLLGQGAVLVDEADDGTEPSLLVYLEHAVRDGRVARSGEPRVISQRLQFIHLKADGIGRRWWLGALPRLPADHGGGARGRRGHGRCAQWLSGNVEERALGSRHRQLGPRALSPK